MPKEFITQTFSQSLWFLTELPKYQKDEMEVQLREQIKQAMKQMDFIAQGEIAIKFYFDDRQGKFRLKAIARGRKN